MSAEDEGAIKTVLPRQLSRNSGRIKNERCGKTMALT
jgi:hypothetical protein